MMIISKDLVKNLALSLGHDLPENVLESLCSSLNQNWEDSSQLSDQLVEQLSTQNPLVGIMASLRCASVKAKQMGVPKEALIEIISMTLEET